MSADSPTKKASNIDHATVYHGLKNLANVQKDHHVVLFGDSGGLTYATILQLMQIFETKLTLVTAEEKALFADLGIENIKGMEDLDSLANIADIVANCLTSDNVPTSKVALTESGIFLQLHADRDEALKPVLGTRQTFHWVEFSDVATDPTRVREIFNALKEHKLLQISEKTKGDSGEVDSDDYDNSDSDIPPESSSEEIEGPPSQDSSEAEPADPTVPAGPPYAFLSVAQVTMKGKRHDNEDRGFYELDCAKALKKELPGVTSFFGIYDGHGGAEVADWLQANMLQTVGEHPHFSTDDLNPAFLDSYITADKLMEKALPLQEIRGRIQAGSGAVIVTTVIRGQTIWTANVGDSRALLNRGGQAIQISRDHKAAEEQENKRVTEAGGFVARGRLFGILLPTRTMGDFIYKRNDGKIDWDNGILIATPDISKHEIQADDRFLLLSSDGIFDVMTNAEVVKLLEESLASGDSPYIALNRLLVECDHRRSADDMTCILVLFREWWMDEEKEKQEAEAKKEDKESKEERKEEAKADEKPSQEEKPAEH